MNSDQSQTRSPTFALQITGLVISEEKRVEFEKSVQAMANLADSLGYLDLLDEEPALIFDSRL